MFRSTIVTVLSNSIFSNELSGIENFTGLPEPATTEATVQAVPTNPEEGEEGKVLLSWEFDATKALGEASQRRFVVQFFANDGCDEKGQPEEGKRLFATRELFVQKQANGRAKESRVTTFKPIPVDSSGFPLVYCTESSRR